MVSNPFAVLESAWNAAQPILNKSPILHGNSQHPQGSRIAQLDVGLLDQELGQLLLQPLQKNLPLINVFRHHIYWRLVIQ